MKTCANRRCREELSVFSRSNFCPACRFLGRWAFAAGAAFAGAVTALLKLLG